MKTYSVTAQRTVLQSVTIEVEAGTAKEAMELVRAGVIPLQWPDGNYIEANRNIASRIFAVGTKKD